MSPWARVSTEEYSRLDLRAHDLLFDAPVHDVWRVFLPSGRGSCTMEDVRAVAAAAREAQRATPPVRLLFAVRRLLGVVFGWDRVPEGARSRSFRTRLTDSDRELSLVPPGTHDGPFEVLYVHETEAVSEIQNATVHALLVLALKPTPAGHDLFWAVHVLPYGMATRLYLALINPFRRWIVYPALLRQYHKTWKRVRASAV